MGGSEKVITVSDFLQMQESKYPRVAPNSSKQNKQLFPKDIHMGTGEMGSPIIA